MSEIMTGAQVVMAQLVAEGVEYVLVIPGLQNLALCDTIADYPQLKYLIGRHEHSLAFIANGYARASNRIAVPLVISGPGVTNALTPMGDAYQDSVPMVLICTQPTEGELGKGPLHELKDQSKLLSSVAKWTCLVKRTEEVPEAIRMAFLKAYEGRPGPTVIEIPQNILTNQGYVNVYPCVRPKPVKADEIVVNKAVELLYQARRPLLYVGRGAAISGCSNELRQLAERLNIPCLTTVHGKGVLPENHRLNVSWGGGRYGLVKRLTLEADTVLVIGSSLDHSDAERFDLKFPEKLIQIDVCAENIGRKYSVRLGLIGDAATVLKQLLTQLKQKPHSPSWISAFSDHKKQKIEELRSSTAWQYMDAIQSAISDDTLIFSDPARCNGWGLSFIERNCANTYHCSRNFCTLGYSISAAMGAKMAFPNRQVLAMIGDGGFLYAVGDLATAVQYKLNIAIIIFNDNCYGSVRREQMACFGRTFGVELHNPDFCALANAFGITAVRVEKPQKLYMELTKAWASDSPTIIEVFMGLADKGFDI